MSTALLPVLARCNGRPRDHPVVPLALIENDHHLDSSTGQPGLGAQRVHNYPIMTHTCPRPFEQTLATQIIPGPRTHLGEASRTLDTSCFNPRTSVLTARISSFTPCTGHFADTSTLHSQTSTVPCTLNMAQEQPWMRSTPLPFRLFRMKYTNRLPFLRIQKQNETKFSVVKKQQKRNETAHVLMISRPYRIRPKQVTF